MSLFKKENTVPVLLGLFNGVSIPMSLGADSALGLAMIPISTIITGITIVRHSNHKQKEIQNPEEQGRYFKKYFMPKLAISALIGIGVAFPLSGLPEKLSVEQQTQNTPMTAPKHQ